MDNIANIGLVAELIIRTTILLSWVEHVGKTGWVKRSAEKTLMLRGKKRQCAEKASSCLVRSSYTFCDGWKDIALRTDCIVNRGISNKPRKGNILYFDWLIGYFISRAWQQCNGYRLSGTYLSTYRSTNGPRFTAPIRSGEVRSVRSGTSRTTGMWLSTL